MHITELVNVLGEHAALSEEERQLIVVLVTRAWVDIKNDVSLAREADELEQLLRKISGVKQLLVRNL